MMSPWQGSDSDFWPNSATICKTRFAHIGRNVENSKKGASVNADFWCCEVSQQQVEKKNKKNVLDWGPFMLSSFSILNIVSVNRWRRIAIPPRKIILSIVYHIIISQYIIFSQLFFYFEYCLSQPVADNCWREVVPQRNIDDRRQQRTRPTKWSKICKYLQNILQRRLSPIYCW